MHVDGTGRGEALLCCPEDIEGCRADGALVGSTQVPICTACVQHLPLAAARPAAIPMALGNDCFWGHGTDLGALRGTVRLDMAGGTDRLTWSRWVNGEDVRFVDDSSDAVLGGLGVSLGAELHVPFEWVVRPYGGVEIGIMGIGVRVMMRVRPKAPKGREVDNH